MGGMMVLASGRLGADAPSTWRRRGLNLGDPYLAGLGVLLLGYAVAGKGVAYLGASPIYAGELALALGLGISLASGALLRTPRSPTLWLLLAFVAWGAMRTVLCLSDHGIEALRDAVIWGYGLFAVVVAAMVASRPERLAVLVRRYRRFGWIFLAASPCVWLLSSLYGDALPLLPGTDVPVIHAKSGDILVHLAGIAAFQLTGLAPPSVGSLALLSLTAALTLVRTRGGMLAFVLALGVVAAARPRLRRLWLGATVSILGILVVLSADLGITVDGREATVGQVVENVTSVIGVGPGSGLEGTRSWRLEWWSQIVDYTVLGPHFWLGKGFGPNLASTDGFDVDLGRTLRSPHNGHLTILARSGVPGFLLWIALQASWLREMALHERRSRRAGRHRWSALFLFLCAYWVAFMVNAAFDVYLEGPMGGIWFWAVFGVGLAAARIHARWPSVLDPPATLSTPWDAQRRALGRRA